MNKTILIGLLIASEDIFAMKVAVTDLTYSQEVQGYIHIVDYHQRSSISASNTTRASNRTSAAVAADDTRAVAAARSDTDYSSKSKLNASSKTDYFEYEQNYKYVEYGELRRFSADIKGEMIKSDKYELVQAKPVTGTKTEAIYDIIDRIKKGYYKGADYVLFGTVSDINFSDDTYSGDGTGKFSTETFNLTLTAEFSLINTKTHAVIASFTAVGEGADTKIESQGGYTKPNRARVVAETAKTLGIDVMKQLNTQVDGIYENEDGKKINSINNEAGKNSKSGVTVFE